MGEYKIPLAAIVPIGLGLGLAAALGVAALARGAPPEGEAAEVKIDVIGADGFTPLTLTEGKNYTVRVTVTAGISTEAILKIFISAGNEFVRLIPDVSVEEYFTVGETRVFDFPMSIPLGMLPGDIVAVVYDQIGTELARAHEYFEIFSAGATIEVIKASPYGDCVYEKVEYWNPNTSTWELTSPILAPGQLGGLRITARAWLTRQSYNLCWTGLIVTAPDGTEIIREAGASHSITTGSWVEEWKWLCDQTGVYQATISIYASSRY